MTRWPTHTVRGIQTGVGGDEHRRGADRTDREVLAGREVFSNFLAAVRLSLCHMQGVFNATRCVRVVHCTEVPAMHQVRAMHRNYALACDAARAI